MPTAAAVTNEDGRTISGSNTISLKAVSQTDLLGSSQWTPTESEEVSAIHKPLVYIASDNRLHRIFRVLTEQYNYPLGEMISIYNYGHLVKVVCGGHIASESKRLYKVVKATDAAIAARKIIIDNLPEDNT